MAERREQTEQPDDILMQEIDDDERVSYAVIDGKLVETVVKPARPRQAPRSE